MEKKFSPAKLQAYLSLVCSGSVPVSMPRGVAVVSDVETTFITDAIYLDSDGDGDEPTMELRRDSEVTIDASDGYGLMLPSLAERWSMELGLDYMMAGCNTRNSFEKGMVFTFDFLEFSERVARNYIVKDVWGNDVDLRDVELILTEGMLKLWSSYPSYEEYLRNCEENKYTYCVTKTCPKALENERALNYQFIQSYKLTDDDIEKLVAPNIQTFREVLTDDWRKALIYLKGYGLNEENVWRQPDGFAKAIMVEPKVFNDPYVHNSIYELLKHRITEAKVGVISVHGNYSIASGDPYALCQSIHGLPVTGLLKAGEIYNRFWHDCGAKELVCFRAPMSCHNNIRKVLPAGGDEVMYWFRYMNTCTIFSCWSPEMIALNGMDFDGDLVMLTDNEVLVGKHRETPVLVCSQKNADKIVPSEEDFIKSDLNTFGNDIGKITNYVTTMYDIQSRFKPGSEQYEELEYRIQSGQQKQQDAIDKSKGIISKPMPKSWYDWHEANYIVNPVTRELYRDIVAHRKPYFMTYIYPTLRKQYKDYVRKANKSSVREYDMSIAEMELLPYAELSDEQREFLRFYQLGLPVSNYDGVMNRVCRRVEDEFDGFIGKHTPPEPFDYKIMKSDAEYTQYQYNCISEIYKEYNELIQQDKIESEQKRVQDGGRSDVYKTWLRNECAKVCPNEDSLCNLLLDMCYRRVGMKHLVWDLCSSVIVKNLLTKNNNEIQFPQIDTRGDIYYCGDRFSIKTARKEDKIDEPCDE